MPLPDHVPIKFFSSTTSGLTAKDKLTGDSPPSAVPINVLSDAFQVNSTLRRLLTVNLTLVPSKV